MPVCTFKFDSAMSMGNAALNIFFKCEASCKRNDYSVTPHTKVDRDPAGLTITVSMDDEPNSIHHRIDGVTTITCDGKICYRRPPSLILVKAQEAA